MSPSNAPSTSTPWFGVSMGLLGVIMGYAVATVSPSQLRGALPTPPPVPGAAAPSPAPSAAQVSPIDFLVNLAEGAEFNADDFRACLESGKFTKKVQDQMTGGSSAGTQGTPNQIIVSTKTGEGYQVSGAVPQASFETVIDALLKGQKPGTDAPAVASFPKIDPATDHIRGSADAAVVIVEYSDFQCPFCGRVAPTIQALLDKYGSDVALVYRHFPLSFHPSAQKSAEASECAADQKGEDGFWVMHDALFQNQAGLPS